jgi:hypothetical protein
MRCAASFPRPRPIAIFSASFNAYLDEMSKAVIGLVGHVLKKSGTA